MTTADMLKDTELRRLALFGYESALDAHGMDDMPPAAVVWSFLRHNPDFAPGFNDADDPDVWYAALGDTPPNVFTRRYVQLGGVA